MGKMEAAEQGESATPLLSLRAETATLRQLSTEQQQGWIERLFSRLAALYGASFGRQWDGTDLAQVKTVWAEKLGGFNAKHIGEALQACDEKPYPPNLPEFITLCRASASRERIALAPLPAQISSEKGEVKISHINRIFDKSTKETDSREWAKHLRSEYLAGVCLLPIQISMASEALGETWSNRECLTQLAA